MFKNSAITKTNAIAEIERYIVWPGQALAYKIGQLKIAELRIRAEKQLKGKFDIRDFHDQVLNGGALPLEILDIKIQEWIDFLNKNKLLN